ncbi:MAG: family 78 glycoside hydrolase catalytic domain [Clostridia bacterium]|nr:family 78 glycoside hydrolase catalytic domain [Clostridia bacterium]
MTNPFELYNAKWIGEGDDCTEHNHAPVLMGRFNTDKKYEKVMLYITGLGLFEASVNGKKVADIYFAPGESNFAKRVYYEKLDITRLVNVGENEISILLGNGQYTNFKINPTMESNGQLIAPHRYQKNDGCVFAKGINGMKKAICVVEADGEAICVTDEKWFVAKSNITFQSWYGGEDYDATYKVVFENNAKIMQPPSSEFYETIYAQRFFNPVREIERFDAISITKNGDSYIVDFGKNGAGVPHIVLDTTPAMRGIKIKMFPCEELSASGFADQRSSTQSWSETKKCEISDSYVIGGTGREEWHPVFCYHGFRYLEIKGMPYEPKCENFKYIRLMADNKKEGCFETDNDVLQKINDITERSIESNMFFSFTDCPQIEKLGWLETSHLMFKSMAYGWDIKNWISKIAQDMADSVQIEDYGDGEAFGYMPAIVPEYHRIMGLHRDVNWGGACIMTPWYYYKFYNDKSILKHASAGGYYINHLSLHEKDGLLDNYSQMGDWGQINENTPTKLVENCAYYLLLNTYADIQFELAKDMVGEAEANEVAKLYRERAERVKKAFHENSVCYDKETHTYGNGSQASYGCVLFSGIFLEENENSAVEGLVNAVKRADYHLTSGEVGLKQVFSTLHKYGYDDIVYKMVTNPNPPGYGYFAKKNLTTLPEYWNYEQLWWGMVRSRNHAMMGHVKEWIAEAILGFGQNGDRITIKPYIPEGTTMAKGRVLTALGCVDISWRTDGNKIKIDFTAPEGARVTLQPPKGYILTS